MMFVKGILSALFLSTLTMNAAADDIVPPASVEQPKPAVVDASHLTEVIQVLFLANASQLASVALVLERSPDVDLQHFAEDMQRDHRWMQDTLEAKARRQGISLRVEDLTSTSLQVKKNVEVDFQVLAQKPAEEFRATFLSFTIYQHRKILKLYDQIELLNDDAELKARVDVFRPVLLSEMANAERLQNNAIVAL